MNTIELKAKSRNEVGKKGTRDLRKGGQIPCILYGNGDATINFYADESDFRNVIYTHHVYIVQINIDGTIHNGILKEIQFHPTSDKILHVDFLKVSEDKKVTIEIPIKFNGFAKGVKDGGKLVQELRKLKVSAFIKDLPDVINIDITDLGVGKVIRIEDLSFDGLQLLDRRNIVVASCKSTRNVVEAPAEGDAKKK